MERLEDGPVLSATCTASARPCDGYAPCIIAITIMRKQLFLSGLALLILGCPASEDGTSRTDVGVTSGMDGSATDGTTTSIDTAAGTVSIVLTMENGGLKPTWHNDTDQTIYLAGCTTVSFETVVNGNGTDAGVAAMCVWEGVARPVLAHSTFSDMAFTPKTLGADYRAVGSYSLGCKPGLGITQAACTATILVTSNLVNAKGATDSCATAVSGATCAAEGMTCGGACTDICSFCHLFRCSAGKWSDMEAFPAPCFSCGPSLHCQTNATYCSTTLPGVPGASVGYQCKDTPTACKPTPTCTCLTPSVTPATCAEGAAGELTTTLAQP